MFHLQVGKPKLSCRGKAWASPAGLQSLGFQASPSHAHPGPSGSGKSAAIRLIAAEASRLLDRAPVPTLWHDFNYKFPGVCLQLKTRWLLFLYHARLPISAVDEISLPFTMTGFSSRAATVNIKDPSIYQALRSNDSILILDDIPMGANEEQDKQVLEILQRLARESQIRCRDSYPDYWQQSLHVNPNGDCKDKLSQQLTSGALTARCLVRALDSQECSLVASILWQFSPCEGYGSSFTGRGYTYSAFTLADIAAGARGDIRCAINGLQMLSTRFTAKAPMSKDVCAMPRQKNNSIEAQSMLPEHRHWSMSSWWLD